MKKQSVQYWQVEFYRVKNMARTRPLPVIFKLFQGKRQKEAGLWVKSPFKKYSQRNLNITEGQLKWNVVESTESSAGVDPRFGEKARSRTGQNNPMAQCGHGSVTCCYRVHGSLHGTIGALLL